MVAKVAEWTTRKTTHREAANRWCVVLGAVLIQLALGAIYAWSVFTPTLNGLGWSKFETQAVFALELATFAVVMVAAGSLLARIGPRKLALFGGATLGTGYVLAGLLGASSFWVVTICIGLIAGAGIGLAYVVPIAVGMRWFPDRKGMITGLAVAGFGFGAMGLGQACRQLGRLDRKGRVGWHFLHLRARVRSTNLFGAVWMRMPPKGWAPSGFVESTVATGKKGNENFTVSEMLRTPQFYLIFITFAVSAGSGLMSIGLMKLYPDGGLAGSGLQSSRSQRCGGDGYGSVFFLCKWNWSHCLGHAQRQLGPAKVNNDHGR